MKLHNMVKIEVTISNVLIFIFFDKIGIQWIYTRHEATQGKAIETIKVKQSGKKTKKSVNST